MAGFIPVDGDIRILESKTAFIAMAAKAIGMLNSGDFEALQNQKAWEGLDWHTDELERDLHNIYQQVMDNSARPEENRQRMPNR